MFMVADFCRATGRTRIKEVEIFDFEPGSEDRKAFLAWIASDAERTEAWDMLCRQFEEPATDDELLAIAHAQWR